jgi:hypothetical protein
LLTQGAIGMPKWVLVETGLFYRDCVKGNVTVFT